MRTLLKVSIPTEAGNVANREGRLRQVLQSVIDSLQPEATYFLPEQGKRTALIFFDLKDPSQIPQIAEPLFQGFNAGVEFTPVMNGQELQAGLEAASQRS